LRASGTWPGYFHSRLTALDFFRGQSIEIPPGERVANPVFLSPLFTSLNTHAGERRHLLEMRLVRECN
jgi:hypothetical protein